MLDHPDHLEHGFAARAQLDGAELDAFLEDVGRELRQRADVTAADVDPVHDDDHEADQLRPLQSVDRSVHRHIVQVLADGAGVVGHHHVAVVELFGAVEGEAVLHGGPHHVGDEHRHARGALTDEVAVPIDNADRIVLVFVDVGAEGRAGDVDVDLVGDGDKPPPDHLDGDRIDGGSDGRSFRRIKRGSQCRSLLVGPP